MTLSVERCETCGGLVDLEDLFCANCGTKVPDRHENETARLTIEAKNYQCQGCGASMNYDASAQTLKCPFCGSVELTEDASQGILAPESVVPFALERVEAENRLLAWLGSSFWHPRDLRSAAQLTELTAVYVPVWVFATRVLTNWTADTSHTPFGAHAPWFPVASRGERSYDAIWIAASSGIPQRDLSAIWPFDVSTAVPPDKVDLVDVIVEQVTVSRRYARPRVQGILESFEVESVAREIPGKHRNIHVNVLMQDATSCAALVPIYAMAYRYRERVYRFVINGQSGHSTGSAPVSVSKVFGIIGVFVLIAIVTLLMVARG